VALIFANSEYNHVKDLPAAKHDVIATTIALEKLEFKVFSYINFTLKEMQLALALFRDMIHSGVYGMYCKFATPSLILV
jgi:hypothetical protein